MVKYNIALHLHQRISSADVASREFLQKEEASLD
jgi:hypothetical protein